MNVKMRKDILVIGDSCLDIFVYCNADRLCPDIPVAQLNIIEESENPGMAKNVQRNIKKLVGKCDVITNKNWREITKTRYIHKESNHMFFRVDSSLKPNKINIKNINLDYSIIVISDYNKGFLDEDDIKYICSNHTSVFLDTKKILGEWASNAKFIKINNYEYENSKLYMTPNIKNKIIHTAGSSGAFYNGKNYPVDLVEVKDSSGAGDSFMSGLVSKYLQTENIIESISFANLCASSVVKHRGVTVIDL